MDLGQIVVLLVFLVLCVGGYLLIKKANYEMTKESSQDKVISRTDDKGKKKDKQNCETNNMIDDIDNIIDEIDNEVDKLAVVEAE